MIIKINRLTNFGNYRQFQWGGTANFTKYNLIYGWNYSGKPRSRGSFKFWRCRLS